MVKNANQRVGVFVDVQNMYYSARHLYNSKVNFSNILKNVVGGRPVIRELAYVIRASFPEEQFFFDALQHAGFEVKSKDIQIFPGGAKKGDWDVGIAMDIIRMAPKLDVIILVSGDGDFVDLVDYLQNHGHRVEVAAFGRSTSSKLTAEADEFIDLDKGTDDYLLKPRVRSRVRTTSQ